MEQRPDILANGSLRAPRAVPRAIVGAAILTLVLAVGACVKPEPRRFEEFMDDSIAREGTLARCNQNREDTARDIECANARRAAAAIALVKERERRVELERESERKLARLRSEIERRDRAKSQAMAAALAAAEAAYEAQWAADEDGALSFDSAVDFVSPPELEREATPQFGAPISVPATNSVAPGVAPTPSTQGETAVAPSIPRPFQ
jgi:hypothetical protein